MAGKQRKKADSRKSNMVSRRRTRIQLLLDRLGMKQEFNQLSKESQSVVYLNKHPDPEVVPDQAASMDPDSASIKEEIARRLRETDIEIRSIGECVSIAEFHTYFRTLRNGLNLLVGQSPNDPMLGQLATCCDSLFREILDDALSQTGWEVDDALIPYTRFDERLFYCELEDYCSETRQRCLRIRLNRIDPSVARVAKPDGSRVKAYRVASMDGPRGVQWVSWSPTTIGLDGPDHELPVFMESHALIRFKERLPFDDKHGTAFDWIYHSMRNPRIIKRMPDGKVLVEYRMCDYRFGYFLVGLDEDRFVATSFLFLTMDGTPEGEALKQKLRVGRRDREYTRLDKLQTFLQSDVREDKELVRILSDCGCGHLFEFADECGQDIEITGEARNIREYLPLLEGLR